MNKKFTYGVFAFTLICFCLNGLMLAKPDKDNKVDGVFGNVLKGAQLPHFNYPGLNKIRKLWNHHELRSSLKSINEDL